MEYVTIINPFVYSGCPQVNRMSHSGSSCCNGSYQRVAARCPVADIDLCPAIPAFDMVSCLSEALMYPDHSVEFCENSYGKVTLGSSLPGTAEKHRSTARESFWRWNMGGVDNKLHHAVSLQ